MSTVRVDPACGGAGTGRPRAWGSRLGALVAVVLACLATGGVNAAAGAVGAAAGADTHHSASNLLIDAQEWSLWPSRGRVPAGTIYVELWNRGQDMHDAWVRRLNAAGQMVGPVLGRVPVTLPGHLSQATWHLKAGHYELFCSMPGHIEMGMHARLTVTRA